MIIIYLFSLVLSSNDIRRYRSNVQPINETNKPLEFSFDFIQINDNYIIREGLSTYIIRFNFLIDIILDNENCFRNLSDKITYLLANDIFENDYLNTKSKESMKVFDSYERINEDIFENDYLKKMIINLYIFINENSINFFNRINSSIDFFNNLDENSSLFDFTKIPYEKIYSNDKFILNNNEELISLEYKNCVSNFLVFYLINGLKNKYF